MVTRRWFLATTALSGAAALGLSPRAALALRMEEDEVSERLYISACEARREHDQVVRDLIAALEGEQGPEKAAEMVRLMSCPYCGCSLAGFTGAAVTE